VRTTPAPHLDERRTTEFVKELLERARAWIPTWSGSGDEPDFGRALIETAGRFNSEVAERLDRVGEKMRAGFLDWLAVQGKAATPSRVPVVFKLSDTAVEAVLASAPVRMQADGGGTPVTFETETDVQLVPGRVGAVVGVSADIDAYYLPPPGISDLTPLQPAPIQWRLKSFAAAKSTRLQLEPDSGLTVGMVIEIAGAQYRIDKVEGDIVTVAPPLLQGVETEVVDKVSSFAPFDGAAHNWQEHALYLGDLDLLNIEAPATFEVSNAKNLVTGFLWEYWGKVEGSDNVGWQNLVVAPESEQKGVAGLLLKKPKKGSIDPLVIGGLNSRWIRAFIQAATGPAPLLSVDQITLKVNCVSAPACPPSSAFESPPSDAMANTTPLVLSAPFYPFGRVPRQFDAFYLGNKEAFSKKKAAAAVCFELSDATCLAYAAVRDGSFANKILAGVGKDHALHLFKIDPATGKMANFRGPLRPPTPPDPSVQVTGSPAPVSLNSDCTPAIWTDPSNDFYVAVAAGGDIWIWHENAGDAKQSGWKKHSSIPTLPNLNPHVDDIIVLNSAPRSPGAVLSAGRFWVYNDPVWIQPPQPQPPKVPLRDYAALAPIYDKDGALTDSMIAISKKTKLYRLETDGTETAIPSTVDPYAGDPQANPPVRAIRPAAFEDGAHKAHVVALSKDQSELFAVIQGAIATQTVSLTNAVLGAYINTIATQVSGTTQFQFLIAEKATSGEGFVASWSPTFAIGAGPVLFETPIPDVAGSPLLVGNYLVVPGSHGDAYVAPFDATQRYEFRGARAKDIGQGVIVPTLPAFPRHDFLSVMPAAPPNLRMEWPILTTPSVQGTDFIYIVDPALAPVADDPQLIRYKKAKTGSCTITGWTTFTVTPADTNIAIDMTLRVRAGGLVGFCRVASAITVAGTTTVTVRVTTPLPAIIGPADYWLPSPIAARTVPTLEFSPGGDGYWKVSILDYANLYFLASPPTQPVAPQPSPQRATAYGAISGHPTIVALDKPWTTRPQNAPVELIIDAVIGTWSHQLSAITPNPDLSWEYWNGTSWWSLPLSNEGTDRFATTGAVTFTVPNDIAESDWAGKTNFWIRVRLVGGDYGQEDVKVIIQPPDNNGVTVQTVERSSENIKAPLIIDLHISYSMCDPTVPNFVISQDSGSTRDQSEANRTGGAVIEAFVPLGVTLGRLSGPDTNSNPPVPCPPECNCPSQSATTASTPKVPASPTPILSLATGRALLVGLTKPPSGAPVNILMVVDTERPHDAFAPMKVEALVGDHFIPVVTKDTTRACGETGVLSFSFTVAPSPRELFGENLCWMRLTPGVSSAAGEWKPALRGAYLNAVWASATETLTRELVGSSEGAPNLILHLARPPLLYDSLELRVKEPLSVEERKKLWDQDNQLVKNVPELPGDWVLWKRVIDPGDQSPTDRVYALDESIGEIRFGDGQHGMIPPIGNDSIVAFSYQRTEAGKEGSDDVPANSIAARIAFNLVSPVPSVEAVFAADQAAGGCPPESVDRVVRFGTARLRHRERAVSARDIEEITLQSSPKIVQARCLRRSGYLRLIVVMKGENPLPSAAEMRELRRLLLTVSPSGLSAPRSLRIEGPTVRRVRIELVLHIEDLDYAGEVSKLAKEKLTGLFDTATGGVTKDCWALGENPTDSDIAVALIDTPQLKTIEDVKIVEVIDEHSERPWTQTPGQDELVMLAKDPVRIQFTIPEPVV
jgi:hypothetical protein